MKNTNAYLFALTIPLLLVTPIIQAIQSKLAMHTRIIFPLLRVQTGQHCTMITSARNMEASFPTVW